MQQGIIRITTQYVVGSPIEPEGVLSKWQNVVVLLRGRYAKSSGPGMMFQKKCKKHYGGSSKNITFFLLSKKILTKMLC
jgi:hypothetical protein